MTKTPTHSERVDALLAAPAGRRLLAEVAGVSFSRLLDALELPYPPNVRRLRTGSPRTRRRRLQTVFGRRAVASRRHRVRPPHEEAAAAHREAVLHAPPVDITMAVQRLRRDPGQHRQADVGSAVAVLEALAHAVSGTGFSGNEEEYDHLLRAAVDELRPVAEELVSSPATGWWWDDLPRHDQRYAERTTGEGDGPPRGAQVAEQLARSVDEVRRGEAEARSRHPSPSDVPVNASGAWWSIPIHGFFTSRPVSPAPALHLACAEDTTDERAVVWALRMAPTARILEVRQPSDWARCVHLAPLDVTMSRLGDWRRWTGREGPFYLPDWSVVGEHFDGVHVAIGGYLSTRSVAVPVGDGYSVLAGWDPDTTLWLRDRTESAERVGAWSGPFGFAGRAAT